MSLLLLRCAPLTARDVDVLNQINPSGPKPKMDAEKSTDPGPQSLLEGARHFVKFIFPRQHGFPNPFTMTIENGAPFYDRQIESAISVRVCVIHYHILSLLPTLGSGVHENAQADQ